MAIDLKELQFKYNRITSRLENFSSFLEIEDNKTKIEEIKERLRGVSSSLKDLEDVHCKIEILDRSKVNEDDLDKYENLFYKVTSDAKLLINSISNKTDIINSNLSESNSQVKLPNIQLPSFSGSFTEWITFRDTFLSLIHNNNSLTKIEKFHYLKSSVKSTASQTIEHLTPSDSNYESAWSLLTSRYENKRLITQHHVRALFSLPNASKDAKTLRHLLHGLTSNMKALEAVNRPVNHWDDLLIHLIGQKFDNQTAIAWEKTLSTNPPTIKDFTDFLTQRCQTLESLEINSNYNKQSNVNSFFKSQKTVNCSSNTSTTKRTYNNNSCIICKEEHKLYQCKDFLSMTSNQRLTQVKKHHFCFNCLKGGHTSENCISSTCKVCSEKQHLIAHTTKTNSTHSIGGRCCKQCLQNSSRIVGQRFTTLFHQNKSLQKIRLETEIKQYFSCRHKSFSK
jgi:hypothetical protein